MVIRLEIWGNRADLYLACVYRVSRNMVHVLTCTDQSIINTILTSMALGASENDALTPHSTELVCAHEFESGAAAEKFALRLATIRLKSSELWEPLYEGVACLTKLARDPSNFEEPDEMELDIDESPKTDSSYESDNQDFAERRRSSRRQKARKDAQSTELANMESEGLCTVRAMRAEVNAYARTLNVAVVGHLENGETVPGQIVRNTDKGLHIRTSLAVVGQRIRWHIPNSEKVIGVTP